MEELVGEGKGYRVAAFNGSRRMVAAAAAVNQEQNTIHLITEADITAPRRLSAERRARTGERLSLTGYVVACLARPFDAFPKCNAFRQGNRHPLRRNPNSTMGVALRENSAEPHARPGSLRHPLKFRS
jgi:hypothetical protein